MSELRRMLSKMRPGYELAAWCDSIESAIDFLHADKNAVDIVFADIRLTDGVSFEIFDRTCYNGPVIFTTAYDEYTLHAFKVNGIDYLLKPIDPEELEGAILKFERLYTERKVTEGSEPRTVKTRFLVSIGDDMVSVATKDIAFFNSEDGYTYANTFAGRRYIIDISIQSLSEVLDNTLFCRVSRAYICNLEAIVKISKLFGGRLKIITKPQSPDPILVSRERVSHVTKWLKGEIA